MIKFPSIDQYRNVIRNVANRAQYKGKDENGDPIMDRHATLPTLKFRGTVKLHGSNGGILKDLNTGEITYQSRERELSLTSDNAGFMLYMSSKEHIINSICNTVKYYLNKTPDKIVIFGEWCGGSIQKGVALNGLQKMFVLFAIKAIYEQEDNDDVTQWIDISKLKHISFKEDNIHVITDFQMWEIDIDFNKPHEAQNKMIEITEQVEKECPVGKAFGVSGVGEGVVWQPITPGWWSSDYWFKVKGEKHSVSKVKTLAAVDVEAITAANDFVEMVTTEARLEQGLNNLINEQLKPFEMKSLGDFIRWVVNDVIKEEQDTIIENQLDPKKINSAISNKARKWYIDKFNSQ